MNRDLFRHFAIIIFLCCSVSAFSQQKGQIQGIVKDLSQKLPMPATNTMLLSLPDSSAVAKQVTDMQGKFIFKDLPYGKYVIKASMMGYDISVTQITLAAASVEVPALYLRENANQLKEVVVVGNIPSLEQKADRLVMNLAQMQTAGETALDVLRKAPGVTIDKDDNVVYRGSGGVVILIDGRRTYMNGAELSNYLKQMQAENISKIELIPNPPASYDAEGATGMINIVLKKNTRLGINGSVNAGTGYGKYGKAWGGATLNYNVGKFNLFSRISGGYYNSYNLLNIDRVIGDSLFTQENYWHPVTRSLNFSVGGDYNINSKHTLGIIFKGYTSPDKTQVDAISQTFDKFQTAGGQVQMANPQTNTSGNMALNLNYRIRIDTVGKELNFDADYVQYASSRNERFSNSYYAPDGSLISQVLLRNHTPSEVSIRSVKADYIHPFSKKLKLEAGWKSSWVRNDNEVRFDSLKNDTWISDPRRTDHFIYDENINAGYVSFGGSLHEDLEIKAGLRAEQTVSTGNSYTTQSQVSRNYWELFPSLFFSYNVHDDHKLNASYSRRISRPAYKSVNPFVFYSDPYTAIKGNPFLQPSFSQSLQLNCTYKSFQVVSISYVSESDVTTTIFTQNDHTKESVSMPENLNSAQYLSVSSGGSFNIMRWWNTNLQLAAAYKDLVSPIQGTDFENSGYNWSGNLENYFNFPDKWRLSLSGYYSSPAVNGIYRMKAGYLISTGVRKIFFGDKLTVNLNITDIFDTARFRSTIRYNNINARWQNEWESRRFNLSMNYSFGNKKIATARNRKTGTGDEENRVR
ncbi:MAG TPA: outer membrane beta-barrel family protein [Sphingobacteriaceae bacterium]